MGEQLSKSDKKDRETKAEITLKFRPIVLDLEEVDA